MIKEYLGYLSDVYKTPIWLFIIGLSLYMIFIDSKQLSQINTKDSKILKIIGWVYLVGGSALFLLIKMVK